MSPRKTVRASRTRKATRSRSQLRESRAQQPRTRGSRAREPRAPALPATPAPPFEGPQSGYYRFPAIHGEQIAFCSDDDLWLVASAGGVARRLTVGRGVVNRPVFSPDGRWIAFMATEEGAPETYIMAAEGGEARRLTYLATTTMPVAWTPAGTEIVIASDTARPFFGDLYLYKLPIEGGALRPLNVGPARTLSYEPNGPGVVIARNGGDPARWKRYRGGSVGTLWVDRRGNGNFRQILSTLQGNVASPMWIGRRLYFVSDHEGVGNIYSCRPDGMELTRHTDHEDFYARFPASDGSRIVYHAGADIYLFDPATGETRRVPIEIRTPRPQRQRKFISGGNYLEDYDPHPAGHSIALTLRGRPVAMGFWEGPATEFGVPWQARHRLARWLNDGKRILAVTDAEGEEKLEIFSPGDGPDGWSVERLDLGVDLGRAVDLVIAPGPDESSEAESSETASVAPAESGKSDRAARAAWRGSRHGRRIERIAKRIAKRRGAGRRGEKRGGAEQPLPAPNLALLTNQRQELWLIDLDKRKARLIDRSGYGRILGVSWSADARWIAYAFAVGRRHQAIRIADAATGKWSQVTSGDFLDFAPCFDPDGRYLYFLSMRAYDPVYDMVQFGLGFPRSVRPYLITLRADEPSPFLPILRPLGAAKAAPAAAKNPWEMPDAIRRAHDEAQKRKKAKRPAPVEIDFDGIEQRILAFPIPEGRYQSIDAIPGKAFFLADPIEGTLGQHWAALEPAAKSALEVYDLRELKHSTFISGVTDFKISRDQKTLVYRSKYRLRAVLANTEPGKLPTDESAGRASGWLDLSRVRCSIEPGLEWRQMYAEAWRLQRDQFWVPDMSHVDWVGVYARYLPLVDRVATRSELSDLIWEMQGELGTSHCYEFGGDYQRPPNYPIGFLGAEFEFDAAGGVWKVAAISQGDPWDSMRSSPLASPGTRIRPGTVIHAINGRAIGRETSPLQALVNLAGQEVWLTISDPHTDTGRRSRTRAAREKTRTVTVRTLNQEFGLRYRDWVERNRRWVHEHSAGRIGYLHIPNMGPQGYSEFHRYFLAEIDRDALIVDVRNNGGGHVSPLLLEKLLRRRVGWDVSRYQAPEPYPSEAPKGPMVALTDEQAGSDGDIFSHAWKLYRLGPLIGKRTWGGVIGIWPRHRLVDGSLTSQPEFSFWFQDVGWAIENYGTEPDIEVDYRPQDYAAGRDPQLERGLSEAQKLLKGFKELTPDVSRHPSRAVPRLKKPRA